MNVLPHFLIFVMLLGLALFTIFSPIANQAIFFNTAYAQGVVTLDDSGIPIVDYGYIGETYIGPQRNPLNIAQKALNDYDTYNRTHNNRFIERFLNSSDWLVDNAVSRGNYSILQYQFPWSPYGMQPPWQSGMAQAKALEVLAKAHEITDNKKYLDTAKSLLNAFFVEVKDGGVTYKSPRDGWWYEEYADIGAKESKVLNGMTHALLAINKYYEYTKDPAAKYLFDQGVLALKNHLPRFEYSEGNYSTYDLFNSKPAPLKYHLTHTKHLGMLYDITQEQIFKIYQGEWTNFDLPKQIEDRMKSKGQLEQLLSACTLPIRDPFTQQTVQIYRC